MVRFFDQAQRAFYRTFGKSESYNYYWCFHNVRYVTRQGLSQVLHVRNKYRNPLDKNKMGETS